MSTEWEPPKDDAEFAAWLDNFVHLLPKDAEKFGFSAEEIDQLRRDHHSFRAAFAKEIQARLDLLRLRLRPFCSEDQWPLVFREAFARIPITREPDRSALLRLLEKWIEGVARADGANVRPELSWRLFDQGIDLQFTIPKPCEATTVFYRLKGRAAWKFLITNTQSGKRLYTAPQEPDDEERKEWPGKTLEFVVFGWFENASFGLPSETVAAMAPPVYPITHPATG